MVDILRRLVDSCGQRRLELKMAFQAAGEDGALNVRQLLLMLRKLFTWISRREEMALLGLLFKLDTQDNGVISFQVCPGTAAQETVLWATHSSVSATSNLLPTACHDLFADLLQV